MIIDSAGASDIDALDDLLGVLFLQETEFTPNKVLQKRALERIISDPLIGYVLCARNRVEEEATKNSIVLVGMVSLLFTQSTALGAKVAILEDMIVSPEFRGCGVGSQLLNAAVDLAENLGCKRITLLTDKLNFDAQQFYEKHGFNRSNMTPFRRLL